jgi:membrane dipeptidase
MSKYLSIGLIGLLGFFTTATYAEPINSRADNEPSAMAPASSFEMRDRPTGEKDFAEYIDYLVKVADPRSTEQIKEDDYIKARYKDSMIVDSLWVGAPGFPAGFTTQMYETGTDHSREHHYNVISATITNAAPEDTPDVVIERMKMTNAHWGKHSDKYLQVKTIEDFQRAKKEGKLGMFHNFQGMQPLSATGDEKEALLNLQKFYDLGLRQMFFSYNIDTPYSDGGVSNSDGTDQGVHDVGFKMIKEMNRLGIAVDCSHSSNQTCIEAAAASTRPIMLSHSNVGVLQPIDRNVSDEAIKAVASTGGVICINFIGGFLNAQGDATPFSIAKHAEYIRNLTGPEHVCAGSDYVWNYADSLLWILQNPKNFPIEMGYATPSHMGKPSEMWGAARVLEEVYGWTDKEIAGFLGENLIRFYTDVWK